MPAPARPVPPPLAPLLLLLCALLALLPPCTAFLPPREKFSSESVSDGGHSNPHPPKTAYIPDGTCSGYLSPSLVQCPGGELASQLNVTVYDYEPFPLLHIHQQKKFATIYRISPCNGRALVHYQVWCSQPAARRHMSAAPVPLLPLEPVPPRALPRSPPVAPVLGQTLSSSRLAIERAPPLRDLGYY